MNREDIYTAYNLESKIKDCDDILFQLSNGGPTNMQIQVYSQYGTCHSIEILDDSELIKIVSEYVKKKKGKLEKMLEELL